MLAISFRHGEMPLSHEPSGECWQMKTYLMVMLPIFTIDSRQHR